MCIYIYIYNVSTEIGRIRWSPGDAAACAHTQSCPASHGAKSL